YCCCLKFIINPIPFVFYFGFYFYAIFFQLHRESLLETLFFALGVSVTFILKSLLWPENR
ncbi:hypothetical protein CJ738_33790, partial [Klebsiella pneumoniae]